MTPQMMQSIKLLQLTHHELEQFIDAELERNPLLDRVEAPIDTTSLKDIVGNEPSEDGIASSRDVSFDSDTLRDDAAAQQLDPYRQNEFGDAAQWSSRTSNSASEGGRDFDLVNLIAVKPSLRDSIAEQIAFNISDKVSRIVAFELADQLDEAGYFRGDLAAISARLGVDYPQVEQTLERCQSFDPTGLFARDLAECLSLQLRERDRLDPAMQSLLANLDLLARRDFPALKKICGVDEADLLEMQAEIRNLDPQPGRSFLSSDAAETIVPDVDVLPGLDGNWKLELISSRLPRVLVNQSYAVEVSRSLRNQLEKEFLSEALKSANWLVRSLDQRARTILKVSAEIVRLQEAFLAKGVRHLKPMTLKTVADGIGMHESTVSRVTANKYMRTPRGIFELRFFFTAAISSPEGDLSHSSEAVRDRIRQLINEEGTNNILSDDAIVQVLKSNGISIARRTVAKYRESMNISSSTYRRREKNVQQAARVLIATEN